MYLDLSKSNVLDEFQAMVFNLNLLPGHGVVRVSCFRSGAQAYG